MLAASGHNLSHYESTARRLPENTVSSKTHLLSYHRESRRLHARPGVPYTCVRIHRRADSEAAKRIRRENMDNDQAIHSSMFATQNHGGDREDDFGTVLSLILYHVLTSIQLSLSRLEAQQSPCRVHVAARRRDDDLTEAFNGSRTLDSTPSFVSHWESLAPGHVPTKRTALLIGLEFNKASCCYLLIAIMVLSFILGLMVVIVAKRLDLVLATVAAVAAWVACFEGLLLWMYR